ncbi:MAG: Rpn family recombination-promoting nuclease/putative transposase [Lachnospiraceae bacterium]|nr:Rpn family recombination-promoting nuclease/putative transposase [Lachnospiraceae bacterium]
MSNKRKFQELTIRDSFMFAAVMVQDDNCKKFLEMLLGINIKKIEISYEKCLIFNPDCKGVRLDVYANDENNTRYDVEMQVAEQELGKRIRYYHSQMDMDLLESGHNYKELPATYVIFICNFDPFKKGKYCYTFENICIEDTTIRLCDESISIVLSTEGKNADSIPKNLKNFLSFVKEDNSKNDSETEDEYVRQLQKSIRKLKENRKMERGFMAWIDIRDEIRYEIRDEVRNEVRDEVRNEVRNEIQIENNREFIFEILSELGIIPKEIEDIIKSENRINILKIMVKIAAKTTSFSEFEEKISKL